jgi:membrane-associated phospholipid phosphatase
VQVSNLGAGAAAMHVRNLALSDYFDIPNGLADGPAVDATVSFDVVWQGAVKRAVNVQDAAHGFTGNFVENQATITWSGSNALGFGFFANPGNAATSVSGNSFAELGHERNGIFFPSQLTGPPPIPPLLLPAVTIGLTTQQIAHADAVINWNALMLRAIWTDATPPTLASRVEAMVGVAVYDAVDGIDPIYNLYPVPGLSAQPPPGASLEAAAIAAADTVLNSLYPDQKVPLFDPEYQISLAGIPDTKPKADGIAWGQTVGNAVLALRSGDDLRTTVPTYVPAPPGGTAGVYELTPQAGLEAKGTVPLPALAPQWGQVTPWAMTSAAQFLPPPPPAVGSAAYAADFNEAKSLGDTNRYALPRTPQIEDDFQYAHFWADVPGHSVTPPGHWDEIAENVALQANLNLEQNAHLFALVNLGLADAAINCWDAKYIYNYWRPITAIRDSRANLINPANTSDPNWTPLWNTPNFPAYTSGHSTFSGAASTILASIFGPNTHFTVGSDDMPGYSRSFTSFAQAAGEAGESRVVGGIHFTFDNTAGLAAGRALGGYISQNFLRLKGGPSGNPPGQAPDTPADFDQAAATVLAHPAGLDLDSLGFLGTAPAGAGSASTVATTADPNRGAAGSALGSPFRRSVFMPGHGGTHQAGYASVLASLTDEDGELLWKADPDRPFDVLTD